MADTHFSERTICDLTDRDPDAVRVRWADADYTGRTFAEDIARRAAVLAARGVRAGDRVALFGVNSGPWLAEAFAVWWIGAVLVPVYPTSSAHQVTHILRDSGAVRCVADTAARRDLAAAAAAGVLPDAAVVRLAEPETGSAPMISRWAAGAGEIAAVVYTSGTTGVPKGCVLTHRNLLAAAEGVNEVLGGTVVGTPEARGATQLFLPLSHSYGLASAVAFLAADIDLTLTADAAELLAGLPVRRPTMLMAVPRLLEKIRKLAGAAAPEVVVRDVLGGRLRYVVSGGASTDPSTIAWFDRLGVTILGAYGLTETAAAVSMSGPGARRPGSVGRAIPGCSVEIAGDGEIRVRGPQVSPGYWPLETAAAELDWLPTGDIGRVDEDGYLYVTGRRKEILVTSSGKNVYPAVLEDRIRLHPLVENCMLVGDDLPFVGALVTLDRAAVSARADRGEDVGEAALRAEIGAAVAAANDLVSRAESVRAFRIVADDFSLARGHLTPSLKLRRDVIARDYAAEIAGIYAGAATTHR